MNITLVPIIGIAMFFIVAIFILIVFVIIFSQLFKGAANRGRSSVMNSATQIGSDGFWFTCPARALSVIHYVYWVDGIQRTGQIAYQPGPDGRQFIYTGSTPSQVAITDIADPYNEDTIISTPPTIIDTTSSPDWIHTHSSHSHSTSFPSAY